MSEKRFFTKINNKGRLVIIDKGCHTELFDMTLACDVLNRLDLKLKTYNEQLKQLQDLCGESDGENAKLRIENKRLQKELNDCEKFRYSVFKGMEKTLEEKKNDNGGFQVWEVPPITQGKRISFTTNNDGSDGV